MLGEKICVPVHKIGSDEGSDKFPDDFRVYVGTSWSAVREPVIDSGMVGNSPWMRGRLIGLLLSDDFVAFDK